MRLVIFVVVMSTIRWCAAETEEVSFERDIRPLLSDNCYVCHGPDAEARQTDLRLDEREHAVVDLGGYAAVVPGRPQESQLLLRITSDDPNERMPPQDSGKTLTEDQIALIRRWIEEGASWSKHWSFVPPRSSNVPDVENRQWVCNPIDAFVLARLEREGLHPSPIADRVTILRRLSLDLIGLPPTIDDIEQFLRDKSQDAYGDFVERLLASPHYGERWARHWLDAAQYADSDGFEKDKPREVWAWRDWVISAFNDDLPYDQFVIQQIAGDLLRDASPSQLVATGFLRNSMLNEEGGIDPEQFRMEALFNRMEIIGRSILGLTIQCAQCHSHKYDPLTQTEYYRMLAFLNNTHEACVRIYSPAEQELRDSILAKIGDIESQLQSAHPDWQKHMRQWEASVQSPLEPTWHTLELTFDDTSADGQKFLAQHDGSYLAQGYSPARADPKIVARTSLSEITAIRLELLTDPNLPCRGPGRSHLGSCALSELEFRWGSADALIEDDDTWNRVEFHCASADVNPPEQEISSDFPNKVGEDQQRTVGPVALAIDGDKTTAWSIDVGRGRTNRSRYAIFTLRQPLTIPAGGQLAFRLTQNHGGWNNNEHQTNNLGRFRLSVTDSPHVPMHGIPQSVKEVFNVDPDSRTSDQQHIVFSHWRTCVPEFCEANEQIESLWEAHPQGTTQLALLQRDPPRPTHRLERGDFLNPAEQVAPGVPRFLHALPRGSRLSRLTFAQWLVDRESPTTARAVVNRVWQHYFGRGLVNTSDDLGTQGARPTHPELLDWLAVEFMNSGWSLKQLHRLIVTSATYRQTSHVSPDLLERDPYNELLAHGARYRVDGEIVRDIALASSGLLNPQVGGPSVYSPAPKFLCQRPASFGIKTWDIEQGDDRYRRGIYTFRFRTVPYPVLQIFDSPTGESPCVRRTRSNSPLQALATLNEVVFLECARSLAAKTLEHGGDSDEERLNFAFRCCVARRPVESELAALLEFLDKQRNRIAAGDVDPVAIIVTSEDSKRMLEVSAPSELAVWTLTSRVLLNLSETITKQ